MPRGLADFDLNLLKTFHAVAQTGSVSAAARRLAREQPSVSAALKRLEDHFGVPLCVRSSRGIALTPAGQAVFDCCADVEHMVGRMAAEVGRLKGDADAKLPFQLISDVMSPALDRALVAFHRAHPRVEIKIEIAPWRKVLRAVRDESAVLGVACDSDPAEDLSYVPLIYEAQQLYCGAAHPLFGAAPMRPERLREEAFVATGEDEPEPLTRFRLAHGLGRISCGSAETLREARKLIKMGFGIGFLPTVVAEASDEALWPLLPVEILPRYPVYVVTSLVGRHPPKVRALLAAFLAELKVQERTPELSL
jgi:DNA-binding transcriptional LysR family regulator